MYSKIINMSLFSCKVNIQDQKDAFSFEVFAKCFAWYLFLSEPVVFARTDRTIGSSKLEYNQNIETVTILLAWFG